MRRAYSLHIPEQSLTGDLVVMLHGCVQPATQFAVATRMNDAAGGKGWAVLWPEQSQAANELRCWNWYLAENHSRDRGEPAMLANLIRKVCETYAFERVFVAGISAGAAMGAILGATYPDLVSVLALHSGVPFAAATSIATALGVMRDAGGDAKALGKQVHETMGEHARVMPALVLHGEQDAALNAKNGTNLARQWAIANRLAAGQSADLPETVETLHQEDGRYDATVVTYESVAVEEWRVAPLGHAWSGGAAEATYTDPKGPDATAAILDFFTRFSRP